jgi:CheY-like chemotaxis protein
VPTSDIKALPKADLLCIDDDKFWLQYEKAFLESFGYCAVTATSGREGLKTARIHSFDVVIVDYYMPEMNGLEFAIATRRFWPEVPIIMVSGALDVPKQVMKVVDVFVAKDRLTRDLLPAVTLLSEEQSVRS